VNIVLAVDGSKHSRWATDWVHELPLVRLSRVTAIHVVNVAALRAPFMVQATRIGCEGFIQAEAKRLDIQAKQVVASTRKLLSKFGDRATVMIKKGPVEPTILTQATGRGTLIVLGQRGLTNLGRFLLGSVSTQVSLHARCSVLVVKAPARPVRRIFLAVDGSKSSDQALQFLLKNMRPTSKGRIEVQVLQVLPPFVHTKEAMASVARTTRYTQKLETAGYTVKDMIRAGDPAEEIIKAARSFHADLLIVGAKGLGAVGRFLLGSVSSKLIRHSPCSILVIR
jgi:nucleotide-binding universal stress UspA family protein